MSKKPADIRIFGVRHHGPGCARALDAILNEFRPDAVLLEGPPDANAVLALANAARMQPPVALLVYPPDQPKQAVFYPFAVFSPEWRAVQWSLTNGVDIRFCDLPIAYRLAPQPTTNFPPDVDIPPEDMQVDPLDNLASAAGFDDREVWWDHLVEQRRDLAGVFEAILTAIAELRTTVPPSVGVEAQREAYMRKCIRAAVKRRCQRIAVVCGAWHAPALSHLEDAQADDELLAGLPKVKVVATWIPWTYSRLSFRSGYGAGIDAPGWYEHLWLAPERAATAWAALAARLLRESDLDASAASVIETVRLANAVAALRNRPNPGLLELRESIQTVLCHGESAPIALIRRRLEIGDRLGCVPADAPTVPLQRDLEAQQKRLRLKPTTEIKTVDFDLRESFDREKSKLLHRLLALDIAWGTVQETTGKLGTYHEIWRLVWQVEFAVAIVEANVCGNTVEAAATARLVSLANDSNNLPSLAALLDRAMLAELPAAAEAALARLQDIAAVAADIVQLLLSLTPLVRIVRYGDVRKTDANCVRSIIDNLVQRALVGLPVAGRGLDDDAAEQLTRAVIEFRTSLQILSRTDDLESFFQVLRRLTDDDRVHPLLRGLACRLLVDAGQFEESHLLGRANLELSLAVDPEKSGAWLQGLLGGGGTALLALRRFWTALNDWLCELKSDVFLALLPILRRGFANFETGQRREMTRLIRNLGTGLEREQPDSATELESNLAPERVRIPIPTLLHVLG